jgi:hypothetical protein
VKLTESTAPLKRWFSGSNTLRGVAAADTPGHWPRYADPHTPADAARPRPVGPVSARRGALRGKVRSMFIPRTRARRTHGIVAESDNRR